METFDIIGWVATALTMLSFTAGKMIWLRSLNITACIVWIFYGYLKEMNPIIVTNAVIACIHLFWFARVILSKKTTQIRGEGS